MKDLSGLDRMMLTMFVRTLKIRKDKDDQMTETIDIFEKGFDGVKAENLAPLIEWIATMENKAPAWIR